jgi:hypothetical protein
MRSAISSAGGVTGAPPSQRDPHLYQNCWAITAPLAHAQRLPPGGYVQKRACLYWSGHRPGGNPEGIAKPPAKENNPVQAHFILARLL